MSAPGTLSSHLDRHFVRLASVHEMNIITFAMKNSFYKILLSLIVNLSANVQA